MPPCDILLLMDSLSISLVSILVLVDAALRPDRDSDPFRNALVSILVLVDAALRHVGLKATVAANAFQSLF